MQNAPHSKKQEYTGNLPFMLDKEQHALSHHEIISQHTMLQHEFSFRQQKRKQRESHYGYTHFVLGSFSRRAQLL